MKVLRIFRSALILSVLAAGFVEGFLNSGPININATLFALATTTALAYSLLLFIDYDLTKARRRREAILSTETAILFLFIIPLFSYRMEKQLIERELKLAAEHPGHEQAILMMNLQRRIH